MLYRRLGKWGLSLSEIGFGSWLTLDQHDQALADRLHRTAYEQGINFFDTANAYGGGDTETLVGKALAPFRRETYVLATKAFWPVRDWPFPGANDRGLGRKHLFAQCEASLRRLNTDYLDLYQCHRYDDGTPLEETCRAMHDLVVAGKTLFWGVSEWRADQIVEATLLCRRHGWHEPVSNQPLYNMLERHWEPEVFPTCRRLGLGIVAFSPLCEGLLTGKYRAGDPPPGTRAAHQREGQFIRRRMTPETMARLGRIRGIADRLGVASSVLALAWCLRRRELTSCIVGASKTEQITENTRASGLQLDEATIDELDAVLTGDHPT
ncbi:MAG: aldo/keto reductase family protein [Phycisphaerales bacterium]|nr:aldo/keto reductase family protein [Phycisphaerales bacterium]